MNIIAIKKLFMASACIGYKSLEISIHFLSYILRVYNALVSTISLLNL